MKIISAIVLACVTTVSLASCESPTGPENSSDNNSGANVNADLDSGTSNSNNANSNLTISASGKTYTYGQLKSHYQCVATQTTNAAFKSTSAAMVAELNKADAGSEKDAVSAYTKAALGVSTLSFAGTNCKI